jgi:hypothetical protein
MSKTGDMVFCQLVVLVVWWRLRTSLFYRVLRVTGFPLGRMYPADLGKKTGAYQVCVPCNRSFFVFLQRKNVLPLRRNNSRMGRAGLALEFC